MPGKALLCLAGIFGPVHLPHMQYRHQDAVFLTMVCAVLLEFAGGSL